MLEMIVKIKTRKATNFGQTSAEIMKTSVKLALKD